MNTWKAILAALVIFTAGIVTGGLMVGYGVRQAKKPLRPDNNRMAAFPNPAFPAANTNLRDGGRSLPLRPQRNVMSLELLQKLDTEVHLTQGQREHIEQIIADGQQRNKELWDRITPELKHEMQDTQRRIRDILTEEQRPRFEELMKQRQNRRPEEPGQPGNRPQHRPAQPTGERSVEGAPQPPANP